MFLLLEGSDVNSEKKKAKGHRGLEPPPGFEQLLSCGQALREECDYDVDDDVKREDPRGWDWQIGHRSTNQKNVHYQPTSGLKALGTRWLSASRLCSDPFDQRQICSIYEVPGRRQACWIKGKFTLAVVRSAVEEQSLHLRPRKEQWQRKTI